MTASVIASRARLVLTGALVGLAVIRLLVAIVPDRFFDVDPLSVPFFFAGIGPGASILLDAVLVLLAGVALELERRRRGLDGWLLLLVALPLVPIAWHASRNVLDFWRGADWFAGAMVAAALAHLGRSSRCRELAIALIVGAVAVTVVRGGWQVVVEHPETVQHFEENRGEVFAMKGWEDGSTASQLYERRLRQPEATAWVGFSNVTSGLYGAAALVLVGLAIFTTNRKEHMGTQVGLVIMAVAMLGLLVLNGSKGAILATGLGAVLLAGLALPGGVGQWMRRNGGAVVLGLAVLAVFAVLLRAMLPVDFLDERSLLFRWHYLVGGGGMFLSEPLLGVGPDGFQDAYPRMRPLNSPETPASGHAAWLDWTASLGLFGLAWIGAFALMLLRRSPGAVDRESPRPVVSNVGAVVSGLLVFGVAVAVQLVVEWPVLDESAAIMRLVGGVVGLGTVMLVLDALRRGDAGVGWLVAIPAVGVLAAQGQIEMVFWLPGSVVIAWAMLGLAGSAAAQGRSPAWIGWPAGVVIVGALFFVGGFMVTMKESGMRRSAEELRLIAERSMAGGPQPTPVEIEEARWRAGTALATRLPEHVDWWDARIVKAATGQLGGLPNLADREQAFALADAWYAARPGASSSSRRSSMARGLHAVTRSEESRLRAIEATRAAIAFQPREPRLHLYLAELLLEQGEPASAMAQADEAVRLDEALYLDPMARFTPAELEQVERVRARAQSSQGSRISPTVRE